MLSTVADQKCLCLTVRSERRRANEIFGKWKLGICSLFPDCTSNYERGDSGLNGGLTPRTVDYP
jgi:hypothetical protein